MAQHFVRLEVGRNGHDLYGFSDFRIRPSGAQGVLDALAVPAATGSG